MFAMLKFQMEIMHYSPPGLRAKAMNPSALTFNYQFHQSDRTFRWTAHDQFRVVALNRAYFNLALAMGTIIINIQL